MKTSYIFFLCAFILFGASQLADEPIRRLFGLTVCVLCICTGFILNEIENQKQ